MISAIATLLWALFGVAPAAATANCEWGSLSEESLVAWRQGVLPPTPRADDVHHDGWVEPWNEKQRLLELRIPLNDLVWQPNGGERQTRLCVLLLYADEPDGPEQHFLPVTVLADVRIPSEQRWSFTLRIQPSKAPVRYAVVDLGRPEGDRLLYSGIASFQGPDKA
ncbi:MAG: hypothetical protein AAF690_25510 [Acidobacteriota bacterium]